MYCICGKNNPDGAKFCSKCGKSLDNPGEEMIALDIKMKRYITSKGLVRWLRNVARLEINKHELDSVKETLEERIHASAEELDQIQKELPQLQDTKKDKLEEKLAIFLMVVIFGGCIYIATRPMHFLLRCFFVLIWFGCTWKWFGKPIENYSNNTSLRTEKKNKRNELMNRLSSLDCYKAQLEDQLASLKQQIAGVTDALRKYYEMNIVHRNYQGLLPITSLYDYFEEGRCCALLGADGAYNLFRQENLGKQMVSKLDDLIDQVRVSCEGQGQLLKRIEHSNHILETYKDHLDNIENQMNYTNEQISAGNQSLQKLVKTNVLTNEYARITAENTNSIKAMSKILNETVYTEPTLVGRGASYIRVKR